MRVAVFMVGFIAGFWQLLNHFSFWATFGVLYLMSLSLVAGVAFLQRQTVLERQDEGVLLHKEALGHGRNCLSCSNNND